MSISERREQGRKAYAAGLTPVDNPYEKENWNSNRNDWFHGWYEAWNNDQTNIEKEKWNDQT